MDDLEIQKHFFRPICNEAEIERVLNVQNAKDYLLKIRAETIVDHMRLFRVYRNKAIDSKRPWSLERSFSDNHYKCVISKLGSADAKICKGIVFGDVFSDDPDGLIFSTEYGIITTISDSLKYFLEFSHIALLNFSGAIPPHVKFNALRIAMRIMLKTEALDFYMDPRGIIPKKINRAINSPIRLQMQFIAGHEFSHLLLNHLSENNVSERPIFRAISNNENDYKMMKTYNNAQKNEFEADVQSIMRPNYFSEERCELLSAALLWFGALDLYQGVCDVLFPQSPLYVRTHPSARERYENLLHCIPTPKGFDHQIWSKFPEYVDLLKERLQEDVSVHADDYERYGSIYLDSPNTEWRGKELIDRVDYY